MTKRNTGFILQIPIDSNGKLRTVLKLENLLRQQLDIIFDTGYDRVNKLREWYFDWSLSGATVKKDSLGERKL